MMEKMKSILSWFFKYIFSNIMILFYAVMIISLFLQVFTRYILKLPLFWTEELSRYTFLWFLFLGSGIAFYENSHIKVEMLTSKLPRKLKNIYQIAIHLIIISYLIIVVWKGFELIHFVRRQVTPALQISRSYPYMAIPVGSILMILGLMYRLIVDIQNIKKT